ncbi:regulatory protein RecX [Deinococcus cellulosilyticus]|uniref:Regulatory protein RecX n=1 Tax=Deinococcus cellulosilyticus (strain DSM 18568 / NBRC 106333 / KACC 11606 / 5516J-15) TaxID=1223518 RepID=A0A511N1I1_DEIC1|nr:RecX family transcriptional regulator [Deinococcus cellulosilyticus]GEM46196.1 hypothetical protein DC3_18310 [Deinococcus cellulosilyticus NBRC 106333 = KACC 11606]
MEDKNPVNATPAKSITLEELKAYAFRALAQKQLSEHELRTRLKRRGATPEQSDQLIELLKGYGYLNDQEVARTLARKRGVGRGYIQQKLYEKGVKASAKTLRDDETEEEELQALIDRNLEKWQRDGEKGFRRAVGFLVRRGFEYGKVLTLLKASFQLDMSDLDG